jgi:hypothetical protein
MQVKYRVQNPHVSPNAVRAVIKGVETTATIDMLEVELVAEDLANGGVKLRFSGADIEAAKDLFKTDVEVTATFTVGAAPAA